jgi:hypothetical protein
LSTETELAGRTIIIHQSATNYFSVAIGNRRREDLTSDECLWTIANLLMNREPSYGLLSLDEIQAEAARRAVRKFEQTLRPFEKLIEDKKP